MFFISGILIGALLALLCIEATFGLRGWSINWTLEQIEAEEEVIDAERYRVAKALGLLDHAPTLVRDCLDRCQSMTAEDLRWVEGLRAPTPRKLTPGLVRVRAQGFDRAYQAWKESIHA